MAKHNLKYTGVEIDSLLDNANSLSGIIVMWSGAIDKIPTGWVLCDGANGTPDLRNRFIVGAGTDYTVGNTGGSDNVALTTAQMPSHTHTGSTAKAGSHTHTIRVGEYSYESVLKITAPTGKDEYRNKDVPTNSAGEHTHTLTINSAGSGESHENRPPYYALAYIMKL